MIFTLNKLRNKLEKESVDIIERSYINHKRRTARKKLREEMRNRIKQQEILNSQHMFVRRKTRAKMDRVDESQETEANHTQNQAYTKFQNSNTILDSVADVFNEHEYERIKNNESINNGSLGGTMRQRNQYLSSTNNISWNGISNSHSYAINSRLKSSFKKDENDPDLKIKTTKYIPKKFDSK